MPFPKSKRVIFTKNPLEEVICQFRYPTILKIDSELPAEFQERIRGEYPHFTERSDLRLFIPKEISDQLPQEAINSISSSSNQKTYEFTTEDKMWTISLTNHFLALTSRKYRRWEEYKTHLIKPFEALLSVYSPHYFSRIGLRYKDVIKRSELGLEDIPWNKLLKPHIAGILVEQNVIKSIKSTAHRTEIQLDDPRCLVRLQHGFMEDKEIQEIYYLIDSDFFTEEKIMTEDALTQLDYFNERGSRLIQWCITDVLHKAMEPQQL